MRERFFKEGFEGFSDYEILEMILYSSRARGNTNDIAHRLIEEFGSFREVFDADPDMTMQVEGIGEQSAVLIKLILEACRRYSRGCAERGYRYNTISRIGTYLYRQYIGVTRERLYAMLFNNRMNLLDCVLVSEGTVTATGLPLGKLNDIIVKKRAAAVVLAHNHPQGLAVPSQNDYELTDTVRMFLDSIDVTLVEHLIIADNRFFPIMKERYGMFRVSPVNSRVESGFYELFYDVDFHDYQFPSPMDFNSKNE